MGAIPEGLPSCQLVSCLRSNEAAGTGDPRRACERPAFEAPIPCVPVFVVANDVSAIDFATPDVIDAFRKLNVDVEGPVLLAFVCFS